MKRVKRNSELWKYLNDLGVLEKGSDEQIKEAKKKYRQQYLRKYKKEHRRGKKEFSITCNRDEEKRLVQEATGHGLTPSRFLKKAAFAYSDQIYIVPHIGTVQHIEQILITCKSTLERIAEKDPGAWFKQDRNYAELERLLQATHKQIIELFAHPPTLETVIIQTLSEKPAFVETLKKIIAHYDSQKHVEANRVIRPAS